MISNEVAFYSSTIVSEIAQVFKHQVVFQKGTSEIIVSSSLAGVKTRNKYAAIPRALWWEEDTVEVIYSSQLAERQLKFVT